MSEQPLKLRAQDKEDVQVIAAVLQDAIAPVCDMVFKPAEKSFIMVVHRFCWDRVKDEGALRPEEGTFERVCCALDIQGVEAVQMHGFNQTERGQMLDLLTLILDGNSLNFVFAGGAELKLKMVNWQLRLEDFGESWPTTYLPRHMT